jgi:hypothetical protein
MSIGVTEFQSSEFTIWINFRIFLMSIGGKCNGVPCKEESIPVYIHHFCVELAKIIKER